MKNKILSWVTAGLSILTIFPLFLGIYVPFITMGNKTETTDAVKLFDSMKGSENTWAHTLFMILVFVALALAITYIVLTLLDTFGKGKGFDTIRKYISIAMIVVSVLMIVFALVFMIGNGHSSDEIIKISTGLNAGVGLIFAIVVPFICGILGLFATRKSK